MFTGGVGFSLPNYSSFQNIGQPGTVVPIQPATPATEAQSRQGITENILSFGSNVLTSILNYKAASKMFDAQRAGNMPIYQTDPYTGRTVATAPSGTTILLIVGALIALVVFLKK